MEINHSQINAIKHNTGPMLVLAGPGSGKTLVITRRVQELISTHQVNPSHILVITFTKAAASEMKERFKKLNGGNDSLVHFGTFHSVYFHILKYAYNYNASNILREDTKFKLLKEILDGLEIEIDDEKEFLQNIGSEISLVKSERMSLDHYYSINCSDDIFKKFYHSYEDKLRRSNLIDFDDMLVFCYELLKMRPDILSLWQKKFRYILIDEFQDINKIQYDIIRMLALPENNLFIVGDDDQSIYRFRGAKPEIMLNFSKDYPESKEVLLNYNYRCPEEIVKASSSLIEHNTKRFPKEIIAYKKEGERPAFLEFAGLKEQNSMVVAKILEYSKKGIPFSQMAILYRTNTQPMALLEKIMEYNIPFTIRDAIPNMYDHWIAKNVKTYIRLALGERDRGLFLSIANRPKRYLSRECFSEQQVDFFQLKRFYIDKPWILSRVEKLEYDLSVLKNLTPYGAIQYIRKGMEYEEYLKEYADFRRIKAEELYDTLNELEESAKPFATYEEWFRHMEEYKEELERQSKDRRMDDGNRVTMATMHSAKGLEYLVVFAVDVNEGITPHRKATLDEDIEEERRLFYVALTRAKEFLNVYWVRERYNKEMTVSRFVGEILMNRNGIKEGTEVVHRSYGKGIIRRIEGDKLVVFFEKVGGEKVLSFEFCVRNQLLSR